MVQGLGVLKNKQSKTIRKSGPNTSKKGLVRADPKKKSLIKSHQMKKVNSTPSDINRINYLGIIRRN
jgi:hypothetical protein